MRRPVERALLLSALPALVTSASCSDDIRLGGHGRVSSGPPAVQPDSGADAELPQERDSGVAIEPDAAGVPDATGGVPDAGADSDAGEALDSGTDADTGSDAGACGTLEPLAVAPSNRVVAVYLAAADAVDEDTAFRRAAFGRALTGIQRWYAEKMGPTYGFRTFRFEPPMILKSRYTRSEWESFAQNGFAPEVNGQDCGLWHAAATELDAGLLEAAGLPPSGSGVFYSVLAGNAGSGGGCITNHLAVLEEMWADRAQARCPNGTYDTCVRSCSDPEGLGALDPWCREWPYNEPGLECSFIGAHAYDIGLGLGLLNPEERPEPDRTDCSQTSIMGYWWEYDRRATLCNADTADLAVSPFTAEP